MAFMAMECVSTNDIIATIEGKTLVLKGGGQPGTGVFVPGPQNWRGGSIRVRPDRKDNYVARAVHQGTGSNPRGIDKVKQEEINWPADLDRKDKEILDEHNSAHHSRPKSTDGSTEEDLERFLPKGLISILNST
ncbi:hypothetical protein PtB15_11B490 [Puccinia triticina]|nr:hypothetical protein PtB15_11B490 [Puccinia triticina]